MAKILTKEELVKVLDKSLFDYAYKDIERASIQGDAKMAGFILGCCFIDAMAGFYTGINKKEAEEGNPGPRFKNFVREYLPRHYDPKKLWKDLRCGLIHNYTEGGSYVFTDGNKAGFHFDKYKDGRTILNLEDFVLDLKKAYKNFREDILSDDELLKKAIKRYLSMGLIGPIR